MNGRRWLFAAMLASVSLVGVAMFLDEQREFDAALLTLRDEQVSLATALGADFEARLASLPRAGEWMRVPGERRALIPALLGGAIELEQPRSRMLLVAAPGDEVFFTTQARAVAAPLLRAALRSGNSSVVLPREAARALGLPERLAVAGIRRVEAGGSAWAVAVLASAERLRARERHAQLRFLLGLCLVSMLVGGFGGLALRDQRRQLAVARELEVAALQRDRERLLNKADKMATLAALSSGIAHQIATPLGTITARVEQVMPAVATDDKATAALRVVYEQVLKIQRVIRGVLDLARGHQPALVHARPGDVLGAALGLVRHRLDSLGLSAAVTLEPELPLIACDPPMVEQALVNLLLNAVDASAPGAQIAVRVRRVQAEVWFQIEDEGEGISAEAAARAVEPFFTTKSKERGTGLGLSIAQEVVANHGGKLTLERRDDAHGTRATIVLPGV